MSKITSDGLTLSGTECFITVTYSLHLTPPTASMSIVAGCVASVWWRCTGSVTLHCDDRWGACNDGI